MSETNLLVVAGEPSGDHHLSKVVLELKKLSPHLKVWGIGGEHLRQSGGEVLFDNQELAVVGIKEVIRQFPAIKSAFYGVLEAAKKRRPVAALLVDYPDFNLRLAKKLNRMNIPVYYYIAPQVWAWRAGRVKLMKKLIKKLYTILPFEEDFFRQRGLPSEFVGHPILDESWVNESTDRSSLKKTLIHQSSLETGSSLVALLPGSRMSEVRNLLDLLLKTAKEISSRESKVHFVLPVAEGLNFEFIQDRVSELQMNDRVTLLHGKATDCLRAADVAVVASGTATLEAGVAGVPLVVTYRVSALSAFIFKFISNYQGYMALVNLVAGKKVASEYIQESANYLDMANEIVSFLNNPEDLKETREKLKIVRSKLGSPGGSRRVAKGLVESLSL